MENQYADETRTTYANINGYLEFTPLKGLSFRSQISTTLNNSCLLYTSGKCPFIQPNVLNGYLIITYTNINTVIRNIHFEYDGNPFTPQLFFGMCNYILETASFSIRNLKINNDEENLKEAPASSKTSFPGGEKPSNSRKCGISAGHEGSWPSPICQTGSP